MEHKELQRAIISIVLTNTDYLDELIDKTEKKYFDDPVSCRVYEWLQEKYRKAEKPSMAKFMRELDVKPTVFDIDGVIDLEFDDYIEILHKDYTRKKIAKSAKKIHQLTKKEDIPAQKLQSKAQDIIFRSTMETDNKKKESTFGEALRRSFDDYTLRLEGKKVKGLKTGFPTINGRLGGVIRSHLYVIGGDTSMGKTAYAISLIRGMMKKGYKGAFISLEMEELEILDRFVAIESRVDATNFANTNLNKGQKKNINESYNRLNELNKNMKISYERGLTVEEIKAKCRKFKRDLGQLDFVVIDYLTMIKRPGRKSKTEEIGEIVLSVRNLAQEVNAPIFLLSQTNRQNADKKPSIHDLRASGWIEEIADSVWLVWRPEQTKDPNERKDRQVAQLLRVKERTGQPGKDKYYFYAPITLWRDSYWEEQANERPLQILKN